MTWQDDVLRLLPRNDRTDLVISPDVDGLLSAAAIGARRDVRIVGIYTTRHVILLGDATMQDARRALWIDHDVSRPDMRCIGQHLTLHADNDQLPLRSADSFNPNNFVRQSYRASFRGFSGKSRDKYPFGTVHLLRDALGLPPPAVGTLAFAALAHADGSWATACDYLPNCEWWRDNFFSNNPFIGLLLDGYTKSSDALTSHQNLCRRLVDAGVRSTGSRERDSPGIARAWSEVQGKQSVLFAVRTNSQKNLLSLQRAASNLSAVAKVLSSVVDTPVPEIARVREYVSGIYNQVFPNQVKYGEFDQYMVANRIFSHAFTAQNSLRYTTGLFDD